jgi:hypothetical protein
MTRRANGFASGTEALGRIGRGVFDVSLLLMAGYAAIRRHGPHFVGRRSVTLHAFDLLPEHVNAMPRDVAGEAPSLVDINASAPFAVLRASAALRRSLLPVRRILLIRAGGEG